MDGPPARRLSGGDVRGTGLRRGSAGGDGRRVGAPGSESGVLQRRRVERVFRCAVLHLLSGGGRKCSGQGDRVEFPPGGGGIGRFQPAPPAPRPGGGEGSQARRSRISVPFTQALKTRSHSLRRQVPRPARAWGNFLNAEVGCYTSLRAERQRGAAA